jgi:hypothetical protein
VDVRALNPETLKAMKEAAEKATPGPWYVWNPFEDTDEEEVVVHGGPRNQVICRTDDVDDDDKDNANFIAICNPANVSALIAEVERQAREIERLNQHVTDLEHDFKVAIDHCNEYHENVD